MIPKISRGQKMGGLLVYLLGPGDHNEHKDRHIVAGSSLLLRAEWMRTFDGPADKQASRDVALAVAHEIEIPRQLWGTKVRMRAKAVPVGVGARGESGERGLDVVEPAGKGEKGEMRDAPVWHCVLALEPGEDLDDARWAAVANDFMDRMGFAGTADGKVAPARWAAVRHGKSGEKGEGQEHIHIAASLVREDGSKVSTFDYGPGKAKGDWKRAQQVCNELEHAYGLKVLASREHGNRGLSGDSRAEIERAKRIGAPESERDRLRRLVRAAATATDTEAEFVKSLRESGISVAPRYERGGSSEVSGYKVRFRRDDAEVGPWVGGGTLAGDLTLTALREQQWNDSAAAREDALAVWRNDSARRGRQVDRAVDDPQMWRQAAAEIGQWRERMEQVPHADRAQWAWMAGQAAGVFAAWSEVLEGDKPGVFAAAHKELARSAQVQYASQRYKPSQPHSAGLGAVTRVLFEETFRDNSPVRRARSGDTVADVAVVILLALLLLLLLAIAIAAEIAQAHRQRGQLTWAVAIEQATVYGLDPVRANWQSMLDERRHQFDRDAANVFAAAAGRRSEKTLAALLDRVAQAEPAAGERDAERAEEQLDAQRLAELTAAAEELVPGVSDAEAWPALRARLAAAEVDGRDAIDELRAAIALRELGSADDITAVLIWRLDQLDTITTATTATEPAGPTRISEREASKATQGPLPPSAKQEPPLRKPVYYTEMSSHDQQAARAAAAGSMFGNDDFQPSTWSDARLTWELTHLRAETQLLADDLEDRRAHGGPHARQARDDIATFVAQAEKIPAAREAEETARALETEQRALKLQARRLAEQLQATPKRKARKQLQDKIDETAEDLAEITPKAAEARTVADAAAEQVGVPAEEWAEVQRRANPRQQQWLLKTATDKDQASLTEDEAYLYGLQSNLEQVECEHARREAMTPQQRAAAERAPRVAKGRSLAFDQETSTARQHQSPTLGFDHDRDQGPEL
ncbi:relaxase/mobilization nuclease domain-containing protein [Nocardia nova]|uniref:relaxase/mobilization nuclease domain-containing protein n=1 Tax=Nocardia nova TaxID=37330 RepID=UPI003718A15F